MPEPHDHTLAMWFVDHAIASLVGVGAAFSFTARWVHGWLTAQFDRLTNRISDSEAMIARHETRLARHEAQQAATDDRLDGINETVTRTHDLTLRIAGKLGVD